VFTGLLPSSGRPSVVGCALVGTCVPIRLLATAQSVTVLTSHAVYVSGVDTKIIFPLVSGPLAVFKSLLLKIRSGFKFFFLVDGS
jgi:hypothetical protein